MECKLNVLIHCISPFLLRYLLEPHNVHGEYQDELKAFYKEHGVKVKIPLDKTQPDTDNKQTEKVMNEQ